jgi:hypothetical protein
MPGHIETARDLINAQYAVNSQGQDAQYNLTIAGGSTIVARNNPNRVTLEITNTHATAIVRLRPQQPASNTAGFVLGPGATLALKWRDDFERTTYEWQALTDTDNAGIYTTEQVLVAPVEVPA